MKLGEIAERLACELHGSPDLEIRGVAGIETAQPDELTFLSNPKYIPRLKSCRAGAVILGSDAPPTQRPHLISPNPYLSFAQAIELFYRPPEVIPGIHPTAVIGETAVLGENYSIGAHVVIGEGVTIGNNAVLHSHAAIYPHAQIGDNFLAFSHCVVREYCRIGHRVILQNGAIIGADGFGFAPRADGSYYKIVQSGIVVLEDDVEIGAHTCVDRATVGETRIRRGAKIDNLVQIGHGCDVGEDSVLASQVGLAGTTRLGRRVMLGGQVGVAGHLEIGEGVQATPQTGIARSVEAGRRIAGSPELDVTLWKRNYLITQQLPELAKTIRRLEREVAELKARLKE